MQGRVSNEQNTDLPTTNKKARIIHNTRCRCTTSIHIKLFTDNTTWEVIWFDEIHNHDLASPSKRRYRVINRKISNHCKNLLSTLTASTVLPSTQFSILSNSLGRFKEVGFTRIDFKNMRQNHQVVVAPCDIDLLVSHFQKRRKMNQINTTPCQPLIQVVLHLNQYPQFLQHLLETK